MTLEELQNQVRETMAQLLYVQENIKRLSYNDCFESFAEISTDAGYDLNGAVGGAISSVEIAINTLSDVEMSLALAIVRDTEKESFNKYKKETADENPSRF